MSILYKKLYKESFCKNIKTTSELNLNSSKYLKEQLVQMIKNWNYSYRGPYAVLEQSNGFGKTKACLGLVDEECYVVYCCLDEKKSNGYPQRSFLADEFLYGRNLEKFYTCYFNAFIDLLNTTEISCLDFFNKYIKNSDRDYSQTIMDLVESQIKNFSNDRDVPFYKGNKPLIFIFDDASSLLKVNRNYKGSTTCFDLIRNVLSNLRNNIFVLFVNMFTISSNFDVKIDPDPSARIAYRSLKELEPIYLLPTWDLYADQVKIEKISDSVKFENICMYGRPLWGSLLQTRKNSGQKYDYIGFSELYDLAIFKLTCGKMTESLNSNDILAVVGCRLGVIQPKSISRRQELVANNMAVCVYVKNSEYLFDIVYPSEPILAESAAFVKGVIGYVKIVESLIESLESSSVSIDDKAGLIGKLILLIAKDKAGRSVRVNEPFLYLNVVQVGVFLQKLYGECDEKCGNETNNWTCSSQNKKCVIKLVNEQLQDPDTLLNGYINFNHFVQSKTNMSETQLLPALKRCVAFQCKQNEKSINFVIPVCLNKDNLESISAIMVKVKLNNNPKNLENKSFVEYAFTEMSEDFDPYKGFLVLYMQLGQPKNKTSFISSLKPKEDHEFNKYHAIIYSQGISRDVFPILESDLDEKLVKLSQADDNPYLCNDFTSKKIYDSYFSL
ncbi:unnamed protein product [Brachionus calyciflorus]|uniref:Uncharacterized protein n=1 Tax=Brachionus calyciflorus TaxID=104777 RepID=A0A814EFD3_9BILA|nr:unnamed protein product [Brachionus calyciflorus]